MRQFRNFYLLALLTLLLALAFWAIPPTKAGESFIGDSQNVLGIVPIVAGTEADAGGDVVAVDAPTPSEGGQDGVFLPYTFLGGLAVFVGAIMIALYRAVPPSAQQLYSPFLDVTKGIFEWLKSLPGTRYDELLERLSVTVDDVKNKIAQSRDKPDDPLETR